MARIEELYEQPPIEIEMVGGHRDGDRMFVPDDREMWLMPIPVNLLDMITAKPDVTRTLTDNVERYRRAGIRDDGTRVFQYDG